MTFKNIIPTNTFNTANGIPLFCVKIVGRNTRCRKVVFVSVNTGGTCEFWGVSAELYVIAYYSTTSLCNWLPRFRDNLLLSKHREPITLRLGVISQKSGYLRWYTS